MRGHECPFFRALYDIASVMILGVYTVMHNNIGQFCLQTDQRSDEST